jgi:hypothetical protein
MDALAAIATIVRQGITEGPMTQRFVRLAAIVLGAIVFSISGCASDARGSDPNEQLEEDVAAYFHECGITGDGTFRFDAPTASEACYFRCYLETACDALLAFACE